MNDDLTYLEAELELQKQLVAEAQAMTAKVCAENEALRLDAERYRWLRDLDEDPVMSLAAQYTDMNGSAISIGQRIDAAIDAAMKELSK